MMNIRTWAAVWQIVSSGGHFNHLIQLEPIVATLFLNVSPVDHAGIDCSIKGRVIHLALPFVVSIMSYYLEIQWHCALD
jgi:hypothetical protein